MSCPNGPRWPRWLLTMHAPSPQPALARRSTSQSLDLQNRLDVEGKYVSLQGGDVGGTSGESPAEMAGKRRGLHKPKRQKYPPTRMSKIKSSQTCQSHRLNEHRVLNFYSVGAYHLF